MGALIVAALIVMTLIAEGVGGHLQGRGDVHPSARSTAEINEREIHSTTPLLEESQEHAEQILFGDLHVHTTFSGDAFAFSLPLFQGEGAHPPADACDFARFCSALDFWSINDHAESLTPRQW